MPPTADAARRFLAAPMLSEIDPEAREAILEMLVDGRAPAGAVLLEQGQPNDSLRFLIEGSAQIVRTYPGGREEHVATIHAPAVFGETSFFRPMAPIVSVRAVTPVWMLTLDHPAHDRLRRDRPHAAEALALVAVRVLAERFDMLDRKISDLLQSQDCDGPKLTEWSRFRSQLFEEAAS